MVTDGDRVDPNQPIRSEKIVPPDVMAWMESATCQTATKEPARDTWSLKSVTSKSDTKEQRELETPLDVHSVIYQSLEELTPEAVYRVACRRQGVLAAEFVCAALQRSHLVVKNRQLTQKEVKALAIALVKNTCVTTLDLEGNALRAGGAAHLAEMLSQNQFITKLVLAECSLGSAGSQITCGMLHDNRTLVSVDLSGNGFEESDGKYFARVLQENTTLKELHLRHNRFREKGGQLIARGLERNSSLELLDLGWNHLRLSGAEAICSALQTNSSLKILRLGYNGTSMDGCRPLAEALAVNRGLEELDLSNNRIHAAALEPLLQGLAHNSTLRTLKLGHNPLTAPSATSIVRVLATSQKSTLAELDLTHIPVDEEFLAEVSDLQKERVFHVTHDRIHYKNARVWLEQTLEALRNDPLLTLSQLVKKRHVTRLVDVTFSQDGGEQPPDTVRHEVAHGILTVTIPVTSAIIDKLTKRLKAIAKNNNAKGGRDKKRTRWKTSVSERVSTSGARSEQLSEQELLRQKLSDLFPDTAPRGLRGFVIGVFEVESVSRRSSAVPKARPVSAGGMSSGSRPVSQDKTRIRSGSGRISFDMGAADVTSGDRLSSLRQPSVSEDNDDVFYTNPT